MPRAVDEKQGRLLRLARRPLVDHLKHERDSSRRSRYLMSEWVVRCEQPVLVLCVFPAEADAVLSHTTLDPNPVVAAGRRHFYLGTISGKKVIVAMTGIG